MTDLQIYLLIVPYVLLVLGGALAVYARHDARRMMNGPTRQTNAAE